MEESSTPRWQLVLETSSRTVVGLVKDGSLHEQLDLGVGRGQNRWLLPRIRELLNSAAIQPNQLVSVVASQGPGSYTGLRVGLTVAKTLAYSLNCQLVPVPTFIAIAEELKHVESLIVLGDALNRTCYVQRFRLGVEVSPIDLQPLDMLVKSLGEKDTLTGPGLSAFAAELPANLQQVEKNSPSLIFLVKVAETLFPIDQTDLFALEPLYLRGSSAEEKAKTMA